MQRQFTDVRFKAGFSLLEMMIFPMCKMGFLNNKV
jgi:hypothetical protein